MYHLKLVKGLSYSNGIISATKKEPDAFTDDSGIKDIAVESGYFVLIDDKSNEGEAAYQKTGHMNKSELEGMTVQNLKKLAAEMGVETTGLKTKADYVAAIVSKQDADIPENDGTADGEVDYGEE